MTTRDPEKRRASTLRYRERVHRERFGEGAGDMRGRHGNHAKADRSARWNGHRTINADGYVKLYRPEHPSADPNGWVYEHRLVMETHLGRVLTSREVVHHKNEDKADNRIENLEITTLAAHTRKHNLSRGRNAARVIALVGGHPGVGADAVQLAFGKSAVALLPAMVRDGRLIRRLELNAGLGRMTWHYWLPISAVPHA